MARLREFLEVASEPILNFWTYRGLGYDLGGRAVRSADRHLETAMDANGVVHVSPAILLVASAPLLAIAYGGRKFGLGLEGMLLTGIVRSFVQLMILGFVLHPIFVLGTDRSSLVFAYVLFMILITTRESLSRTRYSYPNQARWTFLTFLLTIGLVASFAFLAIVRPSPLWNPQYVIPICGMLMGNCINGVSLTANNLSDGIMEGGRREIELYLSFGASGWESVGRLVRAAVATGATPVVNGLNVIGLVSIPGMMTGQILGGSSVTEAAHYQILITWLIAASSFCSMIATVFVIYRASFDGGSHVLRTDRFADARKGRGKRKIGWGAFFGELCGDVLGRCRGMLDRKKDEPGEESRPLSSEDGMEYGTGDAVFANKIQIQTKQLLGDAANGTRPSFCIEKLQFSVPGSSIELPNVKSSSSLSSRGSSPPPAPSEAPRRRVLCKGLDARLGGGEIGIVTGPSGAGKSTLLRVLSGLAPMDNGDVTLEGMSLAGCINPESSEDMIRWRTEVRYVTQYKVDVPGTPREFAVRVAEFHDARGGVPSEQEMLARTRSYLEGWGIEGAGEGAGDEGGSHPYLDKEWKDLSGGESQRTLLAIAMASCPSVLLMDEATSGLDAKTEKLVEESVVEYARERRAAVLWVTHSRVIAERLLK